MLVLDGMVMTTEKDEFVYHEMVAHPALFTHPNPGVFVVGGGDGGVIREVLKHPEGEESGTGRHRRQSDRVFQEIFAVHRRRAGRSAR